MAKVSLMAGLALLLALGAGPAPAQDPDPEFEAKLDKLIETLKNGGEAERADAATQIAFENHRAARRRGRCRPSWPRSPIPRGRCDSSP